MSPALMGAVGILLMSIGISTAIIGALMLAESVKGSGTLNVQSHYEKADPGAGHININPGPFPTEHTK